MILNHFKISNSSYQSIYQLWVRYISSSVDSKNSETFHFKKTRRRRERKDSINDQILAGFL